MRKPRLGNALKGKRYLIHDRDPLFAKEFIGTLAVSGVQSVAPYHYERNHQGNGNRLRTNERSLGVHYASTLGTFFGVAQILLA
jgi:hypothetical protein